MKMELQRGKALNTVPRNELYLSNTLNLLRFKTYIC